MKPLTANDPASIGPFRLLGVLGGGGMGRVYLGESQAGRRVAIKVIRADLAEDPVFRLRFQREVTAARTVSPLYTAPVVEADTAATAPWFATAYIDGPSLSTLVDGDRPLALGAVLTLAAGLAEALASIHEAGLVHRDLTPGNVILDDSGPHVIDFGIALAPHATKLTASQTLLGTPSYIAPEVIEGGEAGPPSDIFALGATLAFAATGKHLVTEGPLHAQILQITRARFDLAAVPKQLRPLIVRCTGVNPAHRPTAAELVHILVGSGAAKPSPGWFAGSAAGPSTKLRAARSRRVSRRGFLVGAGVTGLVAAAGAAAVWTEVFRRSPEADARPRSSVTPSPTATPTPTPTPSGPGTIAWRARSGVLPVGLSSAGVQSPTRIIVDGERLISANSSTVSSVGLDGTPLWTRTLQGGSVNLWAWGDLILACDGQRLWLIDAAPGEIRAVITAVDDELVDSQADNSDGAPVRVTGVALSADTAFVGLNTATIALNRAGERRWRQPRPNWRGGVRPPEGAPMVASGPGLVTFAASPGAVAYVGLRDAGNGSLRWLAEYEAAPPVQPGGPDGSTGQDDAWSRNEARATDTHIVIREAQQLRVLAVADGETVWYAGSRTPVAGIEVVGNTLLVAADRLRAYEVATQTQLWDNSGRGARVAVAAGGAGIFVASDEGLSLVDADGHQLWSKPYPSYLLNASPDWVGVAGDLGYATFRPRGDRPGPLDFDVIAVNLGIAP